MFAPQCDAPLARERSRPQLVTSAPYNGRHSCPPWVWPASPAANLRLGLTHSPEPRVLDRFAGDGVVAVSVDMRVVDARSGDVQTGNFELAAGMG